MTRFTGDTRTPVVSVMCWFLLVFAILSVTVRLGTKLWIFRKFTKDDYAIIVSTIFDIGQGIALSIATENGYGEHIEKLNDAQLTNIMKCQYSQQILVIATMTTSKISFVMFVKSITAVPLDRKIAWVLLVSIWIWGFVSTISVAFQCKPPTPWDYLHGKCFHLREWNNYFSSTDIITELVIIVYTLSIIGRIHTRLGRKLGIAAVFGMRIFVVIAVIVYSITVNHIFDDPDVTYATWAATIANQIAICMSIVTSCSAQFKPFLDSLQSSGMRLDALTSGSRRPSQKYGHNSGGSHIGSKSVSINLRSLTGRGKHYENNHSPYSETFVTTAPELAIDWDRTSQTSQSCIIRETRTWTVTEERSHSSEEQIVV